MTEYLTQSLAAFAELHTPNNPPSSAQELKALEKVVATRSKAMQRKIPKLVELYKREHPNVSWEKAFLHVRTDHIKYMESLLKPEGIVKAFEAHGKTFISKQVPVGEEGKTRNCYNRSKKKKGLAGFREHTLTCKETGEILSKVFLHSSPAPELRSTESTFQERLDITKQNLEEVQRAAQGKDVVEVRLLSPLDGLHVKVGGFLTRTAEPTDEYRQLFLTAIAAELCEKPVTLFNFGVNEARKFADGLQSELNKRAILKLLSKEPLFPLFTSAEFESRDDKSEKGTQDFFRKKLAEANQSYESKKETLRETLSTPEQKEAYDEFSALFENNTWALPENSYKIHMAIVKLCRLLGKEAALGCRDAIDRANRYVIAEEARAIAENLKLEKTPETIKALEKTVYRDSSPLVAARNFSTPELVWGLGIGGRFDGGIHNHLENSRKTAGVFKKHIYTRDLRKKFQRKDKWARASNQVGEFFRKLVFGFLGIFCVVVAASAAPSDPSNATTNGLTNAPTNLTFVATDGALKKEENMTNAPSSSGSTSSSESPTGVVDATEEALADKKDSPDNLPQSETSGSNSFIDTDEEDEISSEGSPGSSPFFARWFKAKNGPNPTSQAKILQNRSENASTASPVNVVPAPSVDVTPKKNNTTETFASYLSIR
ncbi:MAG TPA: hypothetical protein VGV92_09520 [Gammaproteobacteria bacterium]|nr:hypothetical protein [Gammaproteobacteria bacterium]